MFYAPGTEAISERMVTKAALVIPTSKSLVRGAHFLKKKHIPVRYQPFSLIIGVMGSLEKYYKIGVSSRRPAQEPAQG